MPGFGGADSCSVFFVPEWQSAAIIADFLIRLEMLHRNLTCKIYRARNISVSAHRSLIVSMLMLAALAGCAAGPDFKRPPAPDAGGYTPGAVMPEATASAPVPAGESQRFNPAADIPFDWWKLFQSPQINSLVERAFKANPTIESAQAALRQAQEYATAQQGFFYPTVGASYAASRNKLAGNMSNNAPGIQGNGELIQAPRRNRKSGLLQFPCCAIDRRATCPTYSASTAGRLNPRRHKSMRRSCNWRRPISRWHPTWSPRRYRKHHCAPSLRRWKR